MLSDFLMTPKLLHRYVSADTSTEAPEISKYNSRPRINENVSSRRKELTWSEQTDYGTVRKSKPCVK